MCIAFPLPTGKKEPGGWHEVGQLTSEMYNMLSFPVGGKRPELLAVSRYVLLAGTSGGVCEAKPWWC